MPANLIYTTSDDETRELGTRLARLLQPGDVVALRGDLGAGKTVLTRGIARGLGITEPVTSPTFAIVQEYHCPGGLLFYHLDMYRIASAADAVAFGIDDYLFAADAITAIEWPERIDGLLTAPPEDSRKARLLDLLLRHEGHDRRSITLPPALALE